MRQEAHSSPGPEAIAAFLRRPRAPVGSAGTQLSAAVRGPHISQARGPALSHRISSFPAWASHPRAWTAAIPPANHPRAQLTWVLTPSAWRFLRAEPRGKPARGGGLQALYSGLRASRARASVCVCLSAGHRTPGVPVNHHVPPWVRTGLNAASWRPGVSQEADGPRIKQRPWLPGRCSSRGCSWCSLPCGPPAAPPVPHDSL